MAEPKAFFEKIKKNGKALGEHSSNIISHGKEIFSKGKELVQSKEGHAVIGFAKKKITKEYNNTEDITVKITDILEVGNKVKEIVDNDMSAIVSNVQDIKNTWDGNSTEIVENEQLQNNDLNEEDTFFEDNLEFLFNASQNGLRNLDNPEEVLRAIRTLQIVSNETIKYVEEQETKREEIKAQRDITIEKIRVVGEAINNYLERTFDERKEIFSKQFECVDEALRSNNIELLTISLNSINSASYKSLNRLILCCLAIFLFVLFCASVC